MVEIAAMVVSLPAFAVCGLVSLRQLRLSQHADALPVVAVLFGSIAARGWCSADVRARATACL
ncbi:hypothetical protein [Streptomyces diastatochromogenes]|uniref:hypothetical protein n=1 Tax=Streptomyces diastatochromogenes TaxID=42236 RepID=UPI00369BE027